MSTHTHFNKKTFWQVLSIIMFGAFIITGFSSVSYLNELEEMKSKPAETVIETVEVEKIVYVKVLEPIANSQMMDSLIEPTGNVPELSQSDIYELSDAERAEYLGITPEELYLMERVVEKESDRSSSMRGRQMIAGVIFNRVSSGLFPNTVYDVLTEPGQFSTVSNGRCSLAATDYSKRAVVDAYFMLQNNEIPHNLLFFNCTGYNYGSAYGYIDGNYFMTYGG